MSEWQVSNLWATCTRKMKWPWEIKEGSPDDIFNLWRQLCRTPSGSKHAERSKYLQVLIRCNLDSLYELIFSGRLNENEIIRLIRFGGCHGCVRKDHNLPLVPFFARLRERKNELPYFVQIDLDWNERVHGW